MLDIVMSQLSIWLQGEDSRDSKITFMCIYFRRHSEPRESEQVLEVAILLNQDDAVWVGEGGGELFGDISACSSLIN